MAKADWYGYNNLVMDNEEFYKKLVYYNDYKKKLLLLRSFYLDVPSDLAPFAMRRLWEHYSTEYIKFANEFIKEYGFDIYIRTIYPNNVYLEIKRFHEQKWKSEWRIL